VFGNHDFDFGIPALQKMTSETNFPWLSSNVFAAGTGTDHVRACDFSKFCFD
jgi:2',3'-cyclic-nucleotide 2'-phosphodiesterase (5'-nucleotidase family)